MRTLLEYCKGMAELVGFQHHCLIINVYPLINGENLERREEHLKVRVPINELDGALVHKWEKGSVFMKWIKRTIDELDAENNS